MPLAHCKTDIDFDEGENISCGSNGEYGPPANSGDSDSPKLVGVTGFVAGCPTGN